MDASKHFIPFAFLIALAGGCSHIENGFRYEYDGRILKSDGKSGLKGVNIRLGRVDAPQAPDLSNTKIEKDTAKYMDKAMHVRTNGEGHYLGVLETVRGWSYDMFMGSPLGSTQAPDPPTMSEVILYVSEAGTNKWQGYRVPVAADHQKEAYARVRKLHLPDMILPGKGEPLQLVLPGGAPSTTAPTTVPAVPVPGAPADPADAAD